MATDKEARYLQWAIEGADLFSTCGKQKYFAIILDVYGRVVATGYNGGPKGYPHCDSEGACPRLAEGSAPGTSYDNCISIHAEENAVIHADFTSMQKGTLIVNGQVCFNCAKLITNAGIRRVVWLEDGIERQRGRVEAFFESCGVESVPCEL